MQNHKKIETAVNGIGQRSCAPLNSHILIYPPATPCTLRPRYDTFIQLTSVNPVTQFISLQHGQWFCFATINWLTKIGLWVGMCMVLSLIGQNVRSGKLAIMLGVLGSRLRIESFPCHRLLRHELDSLSVYESNRGKVPWDGHPLSGEGVKYTAYRKNLRFRP